MVFNRIRGLEARLAMSMVAASLALGLACNRVESSKTSHESDTPLLGDFKYSELKIYANDSLIAVPKEDPTGVGADSVRIVTEYGFIDHGDTLILPSVFLPNYLPHDPWFKPMRNLDPYGFVSKDLDNVDWQRTFTDSSYREEVRKQILAEPSVQAFIHRGNPEGKTLSDSSLTYRANRSGINIEGLPPLKALEERWKEATLTYGRGQDNSYFWDRAGLSEEQRRAQDCDGFFVFPKYNVEILFKDI